MKSTFIHIDTAVMIGQLHLKGYELLLYALVYGLSKGGSVWVKHPLQWYADTLNIEKGWLSKSLNGLVTKGLIERTQEGTKKYYRVTCRNYNKEVVETTTDSCRNYNKEVVETTTDTLYKNNIKNNNITLSCDNNNAHTRGEINNNAEKLEKATQPIPSGNPENPSPLPPSQDTLSLSIHDLEKMALQDLQNNCEWTTSLLRLYKLSAEQLQHFLTTFTLHLSARGETIKTVGDYRRHLNSWLKIQTKNHYGQYKSNDRREISHTTEPAGADF